MTTDETLDELLNENAALLESLRDLHAAVGVLVGRGPDAVVPDTISTPLGVALKIGRIMDDAAAAIARAEDRS